MSEEQDEKIVDQVFAQRHPGEAPRWAAAALVVIGVYALVFEALPLVAGPSLEDWAASLAARVHGELDRDREIAMESPPPPPPPVRAPPAPRAVAVRARASARPAAPARTAAVMARVPEASPLDFTATAFVTGNAQSYAGGASTSSGSNEHAVEGPVAASGDRGGRARPVSLDQTSWSCAWPGEAETAGIDEQLVTLRVNVDAGGLVQSVTIVGNPGAGFAQAARTCALRTRFRPALDASGEPVSAWSPSIRVRFVR